MFAESVSDADRLPLRWYVRTYVRTYVRMYVKMTARYEWWQNQGPIGWQNLANKEDAYKTGDGNADDGAT